MSVDLSQTHLKTVHVLAIVTAIIGAGIAVARTYISVTWEVRQLATKQEMLPTKDDVSKMKTDLSSELTHAASDRVKFYMEHAKLECAPSTRGHKQSCQLVWPVPTED